MEVIKLIGCVPFACYTICELFISVINGFDQTWMEGSLGGFL